MFIQTEDTPNPLALKFLPGRVVVSSGLVLEFASAKEAETSPLAQRIFLVEGVQSLLFGSDFITVTRTPEADWAQMKPFILNAIMSHFMSGLPVMSQEHTSVSEHAEHDDTDDNARIIRYIKELLDTRVRPAVAQDGGDVTFYGFERGIVYLHMRGACAGCPSSSMTLKMGIENLLRHYVPEVMEVRPVV
jgi:Fe-S cluster biogenesis protein NfuA